MDNKKYRSSETAWCPGCGNFSILASLVNVLNELDIDNERVMLVGGIGQAAKTNQYINANGFSGLHGRSLPAASGIKVVNEKMTVIVDTGDGDSYGEGGNHFLHTIRRNVDITHFVHNNQIYGLTKGQVSPTSDYNDSEADMKHFNVNTRFNPLLIAIASGATFVARSFSGKPEHLKKMMKAAIAHKGYALIDILQPCVSFNKVNTYAFYNERVYELEEGYDASNKMQAIERSFEFEDKIPIGIIYQEEAKTYQDKKKELFDDVSLVDKKHDKKKVQAIINSFV